MVGGHSEVIDELNAGVEAFNTMFDQQHKNSEDFNKNCAAYGYLETDLNKAYTIRAGRISAEIEAEKRAKARNEKTE